MIAVFWDNADFSRGVGTTFYQVSVLWYRGLCVTPV